MISDLPLFECRAATRPPLTKRPDIDARFYAFVDAHPEFEQHLIRFAREALAAGKRRMGMKAIFERIRWEQLVTRDVGEPYALNNDFTAPAARWLMARHSEFRGLFELRGEDDGGDA